MEEKDINIRIMCLFRRCYTIVHSKMAGGRTSQSEILRILHHHAPMTQKQLSEKMEIRQASMSEILSKMEEAGLIVKTRSDTDKRVTMIDLSEKGLEVTLANRDRHHAQRDALLSCFTDEEKETFLHLLQKMHDHLKEQEERQ